jgi:hypothetical protein
MTASEEPFPIVDASRWPFDAIEPAGDGPNEWVRDPLTGRRALFKPVTTPPTGIRQGEDWAEKITSHIAALVGVPAAEIDLAERNGVAGLLSHDLRPDDACALHTGSELLPEAHDGYQPGRMNIPGRPGHSLTKIQQVLAGYAPPPESAMPDRFTAFSVFAGYLVLDALVANQDRHDENWGVLRWPAGTSKAVNRLAPSYDHASSLGFNVRDEEKQRRLTEGSIEQWARRGRAEKLEHSPTSKASLLTTTAAHALSMLDASQVQWWIERITSLGEGNVQRLVARIPHMSEAARRFAVELVVINRRRLLDELCRAPS